MLYIYCGLPLIDFHKKVKRVIECFVQVKYFDSSDNSINAPCMDGCSCLLTCDIVLLLTNIRRDSDKFLYMCSFYISPWLPCGVGSCDLPCPALSPPIAIFCHSLPLSNVHPGHFEISLNTVPRSEFRSSSILSTSLFYIPAMFSLSVFPDSFSDCVQPIAVCFQLYRHFSVCSFPSLLFIPHLFFSFHLIYSPNPIVMSLYQCKCSQPIYTSVPNLYTQVFPTYIHKMVQRRLPKLSPLAVSSTFCPM